MKSDLYMLKNISESFSYYFYGIHLLHMILSCKFKILTSSTLLMNCYQHLKLNSASQRLYLALSASLNAIQLHLFYSLALSKSFRISKCFNSAHQKTPAAIQHLMSANDTLFWLLNCTFISCKFTTDTFRRIFQNFIHSTHCFTHSAHQYTQFQCSYLKLSL